jgi:hypothetical protein
MCEWSKYTSRSVQVESPPRRCQRNLLCEVFFLSLRMLVTTMGPSSDQGIVYVHCMWKLEF